MIAERAKAALKLTTIGVPKALMASESTRLRALPTNAMMTNCRPTSAPADDPTMT